MAFGKDTFGDLGGAVSDLFAAQGYKYKAQGDEFEKQNYLLAADLADKNARFAETSTAIKTAQQNRQIYQNIGGQKADIAGAGFAESGSAIDLLRDSAAQGALMQAVTQQQGLIQEEGYKEQAQSYRNMAAAAQVAIDAEHEAQQGAWWTAGVKVLAAAASLYTGVPVGAAAGGSGGS
jgi:post-segregation antitoxin (ccd killing protein)